MGLAPGQPQAERLGAGGCPQAHLLLQLPGEALAQPGHRQVPGGPGAATLQADVTLVWSVGSRADLNLGLQEGLWGGRDNRETERQAWGLQQCLTRSYPREDPVEAPKCRPGDGTPGPEGF